MDGVNLRKKGFVLDAFSGWGNVPGTAAGRGIRAIGVEVNPFLSFVSKTKIRNCRAERLRSGAELVLRAVETYKKFRSPLEGYSTFSTRRGADKWLFNTNILRVFAAGSAAVCNAGPRVRRFLRLALVKAAMDTCKPQAD